MPTDKREEDDETAVPLLTINSRSDLSNVDLEDTRASGSRRYKSRNDESEVPRYKKRTPLPLVQLLIVSATRLAEPIAYCQIFPVSRPLISTPYEAFLLSARFPL